MKRLFAALLMAALIAPAAASALPERGDTLGSLALPTASGSSVSLAALQGKPVYLNFFATWCGPCNDEAPTLEAVSKAFQGSGLAVIGVDEEDSRASVQSFAKEYGLTYPIAMDSDGTVGDDIGLYATPTNVFIDKTGHVSSVDVGEMTPAQIEATLKKLV